MRLPGGAFRVIAPQEAKTAQLLQQFDPITAGRRYADGRGSFPCATLRHGAPRDGPRSCPRGNRTPREAFLALAALTKNEALTVCIGGEQYSDYANRLPASFSTVIHIPDRGL
jgi:hypothetical protein